MASADWWHWLPRRLCGPRPELVRKMRRRGKRRPGNPSVNSTLNGSPVGTTPNTTLDYGTNSGWIENDQMRAYMNARNACAAQPPDQQAACESADEREIPVRRLEMPEALRARIGRLYPWCRSRGLRVSIQRSALI